jgi:hypothetical protein
MTELQQRIETTRKLLQVREEALSKQHDPHLAEDVGRLRDELMRLLDEDRKQARKSHEG